MGLLYGLKVEFNLSLKLQVVCMNIDIIASITEKLLDKSDFHFLFLPLLEKLWVSHNL